MATKTAQIPEKIVALTNSALTRLREAEEKAVSANKLLAAIREELNSIIKSTSIVLGFDPDKCKFDLDSGQIVQTVESEDPKEDSK